MNPNNGANEGMLVRPRPLADSAAPAGGNLKLSLHNSTRQTLLATNVSVADTHFSRLIGLLSQKPQWTREDRGLWIIPSRGVHTFGMRFAIDVVFLDRARAVVCVHENLLPWRISKVVANARSVIELPVGTIARSRTAIGDRIMLAHT